MTTPAATTDGRVVLRGGFGIWVTAGLGALLVALVLDGLVRGYVRETLVFVPWLALAMWLLVMTLVLPRLVLDAHGITIVNIIRSHRLSWSAVDHVTFRYQLRVHEKGGRVLLAWGAPTAGIDRLRGIAVTPQDVVARGGRRNDAARLKDVVYRYFDAAEPDAPQTVTTRIPVLPLAILAAIVVLCALSIPFH